MDTSACPEQSQPDSLLRCAWVRSSNPLYVTYHDREWGRPCHDELRLFEMLNLEGMQAGLSWETVLNKREHFRRIYDQWDAAKIAAYDERKIAVLMQDAGGIRNRLKIQAVILNAQAWLRLCEQGKSLDQLLWSYVAGQPVPDSRTPGSRPLTDTPLSQRISRDLKKLGFRFVGPTIVYAYMQAIGMVNDHDPDCFLHPSCQ